MNSCSLSFGSNEVTLQCSHKQLRAQYSQQTVLKEGLSEKVLVINQDDDTHSPIAFYDYEECDLNSHNQFQVQNERLCIQNSLLADFLGDDMLMLQDPQDIPPCNVKCTNTSFLDKDNKCYSFNGTEQPDCSHIKVNITDCPEKQYCVTSCLDIQQFIFQNECVNECPTGYQNINNICTVIFPKPENAGKGQPLAVLLGIFISIAFMAVIGTIYVIKCKVKRNGRLADQSTSLLNNFA